MKVKTARSIKCSPKEASVIAGGAKTTPYLIRRKATAVLKKARKAERQNKKDNR